MVSEIYIYRVSAQKVSAQKVSIHIYRYSISHCLLWFPWTHVFLLRTVAPFSNLSLYNSHQLPSGLTTSSKWKTHVKPHITDSWNSLGSLLHKSVNDQAHLLFFFFFSLFFFGGGFYSHPSAFGSVRHSHVFVGSVNVRSPRNWRSPPRVNNMRCRAFAHLGFQDLSWLQIWGWNLSGNSGTLDKKKEE